MYEEIDYERLRSDLMSYYGAAMMYYPVAVVELTKVEHASNYELEKIALQCGFNLNDYGSYKTR